MSFKKYFKRFLGSAFLIIALSFSSNIVSAQDGAALFKANCANCHKVDKDFTGPALKGWADRVPAGDWIFNWVHNPGAMNDAYAKQIKDKWKPTIMTGFAQLSKEEISAIMKYVDDWQPPAAPTAVAGAAGAPAANNTLLFGILTLILAVVAFVLMQVNTSLRRLTDEKHNIRRSEPIPFYRKKSFLTLAILLLFAIGGYYTVNGAIGLGRQKDYMPEQPIFYSHKVHAGVNQISCLYCHGGAQDSKQAGIPSVNVCMNCHMAVKEYTGEQLYKENGDKVDGTAEIQKLYSYAGWNPSTKTYNADANNDGIPDGARPIPWVKIHNLPDHVYFNHSQHVKVGKQDCQTCHGNIQDMAEVKQFSDLSMGWCINCHRTTKVDFFNSADSTGNKFYSIYEKFHDDLRHGKMDSVTVESIGGTECQKCHY